MLLLILHKNSIAKFSVCKIMDLQLKAGENATHLHASVLPRNDVSGRRNNGSESVLGVGGLRGVRDASQVEPLAPL
ncbi:hypothetical protein [Helicobacter sp.]|uniref:hypothetical protein n=1 Tax=Helicobacter sp. TaxID=218 RepID=UPI0025C4CC60|nr:hypothetical protein [Helicobacter sp.]MCI5632060.1 hypothetical protein [Helicobacter sp.]MDY5557298.1 hypothetical protein [Helicobacter sp.]